MSRRDSRSKQGRTRGRSASWRRSAPISESTVISTVDTPQRNILGHDVVDALEFGFEGYYAMLGERPDLDPEIIAIGAAIRRDYCEYSGEVE